MEPALIWVDRHWFGVNWVLRHQVASGGWSGLLEAVYLGNYLFVFGIVTIWVLVRGNQRLLMAVEGALITSLLSCYALYPLLPAITPRLYFGQLIVAPTVGSWRWLNAIALAHGSVPWGILPSGHVAGPMAVACTLLYFRQRWSGSLAMAYAVLVAVSVVHGDYHFVCDSVAGVLVGIGASALVIGQMEAVRQRAAAVASEEPELAQAA
ncbi:MAG TPA: phosphatase PAP2 family protein [Terriglobales bacterium]